MASRFNQVRGSSISLTLIGCWLIFSTSLAFDMGCQEPENFEERKQDLYFAREQHESIFSVPGQIGALMTLAKFNATYPQFVKVTEENVYGSDKCPKDAQLIPNEQKNFTCPWYYVKNIDPNRYPMEIWEARCSCDNCLQFNGISQTSNLCIPVHYNILVLRRMKCIPVFGFYKYLEVLEPIQTGCMCTKINTKESTTPKPASIPAP